MELSVHVEEISTWGEIRAALRDALGESMYAVWIEPLELAGLDGHTVVIRAPAQTQAWLHKRFGRVLERCVRSVLGSEASVRFLTAGGERRGGAHDDSRVRSAEAALDTTARHEVSMAALNPRYSFEQFIIGDGNHFAHAAALAVAELPGQAYNPLFLHAPPGLGKTHLLHAVGNYVLAYGGGAKVCYTTVEAFTNHFISALGSRSVERFKHAYRDADVLLIDDVQFLANKAKTEEEFFHTFNALYERGRQLVLTCDRLPSQLQGIAERLRERFQAGLVAEIEPPDLDTRVAILRKRAALDRVPLAEAGVLELIAERVRDNVRALEGALIRVVAYHSLTDQPIDTTLTRQVLDGMHYPDPAVSPGGAPRGGAASSSRRGRARRGAAGAAGSPPSIAAVQSTVAAHFGLSVPELVSASRAARVAWPRQLALYLARELTGEPLTTIGAAFGGRNHATVLHACKRVVARASVDQQASVDIDELSRSVRERRGDRSC